MPLKVKSRISSENNKSITLIGLNIFTEEQDNPVKFETTFGGVVYDVDKGEIKNPDQNPEHQPDNYLHFTDVAHVSWYYDAVAYVYTNGLMDGVSETQFDPKGTMTRAMVWVILARINGETVTGAN